ncbi:MAG: endonuclease/exonuclease/phosphatase family protein [Phycisphaerae bacterium]|nr:endonuclease/exonuclease/phosphatase family protein [Phycisphaerae bacterium]
MRFRVLTYNIHRAIGVDRKFMPERIVTILRRYDADIVLLQEVDVGVPRSRMMNLAAHLAHQLGYPHRAVGINVFFKRGKYGNATLSHFPIGRQRNIDLTLGSTKGRGAQHTRIRLSDTRRALELDVFNVHLSLSASRRRRQVAHLLQTDDLARLPADALCLIAGDMNDWRGVLKRRLFRPAGFSCATNRRPGSRWAIKTFPSFAPTGGLDKIFYRGPLRPRHVYRSRLALARVASDHLPVIADFEV